MDWKITIREGWDRRDSKVFFWQYLIFFSPTIYFPKGSWSVYYCQLNNGMGLDLISQVSLCLCRHLSKPWDKPWKYEGQHLIKKYQSITYSHPVGFHQTRFPDALMTLTEQHGRLQRTFLFFIWFSSHFLNQGSIETSQNRNLIRLLDISG